LNKAEITKSLGENWLKPLKIQSSLYWAAILLLALFGAFKVLPNHDEKRVYITNPAFVLIAYFSVLHSIIASGDRYHFPIIPFLAIFSAYAVNLFHDRFKSNNYL
jgi:hypothetical protein